MAVVHFSGSNTASQTCKFQPCSTTFLAPFRWPVILSRPADTYEFSRYSLEVGTVAACSTTWLFLLTVTKNRQVAGLL